MQIYAYMYMFLCSINRIGHSHMGWSLDRNIDRNMSRGWNA